MFQRKYTLDILSECKMLDCKPASFPMEQNHKLALDSGPAYSDPPPYRRLIDRLIYLTITRPEITYSVHILSQFMQAAQQGHWDGFMRVLRYLKASPEQDIMLPRENDLILEAYCDSDWACIMPTNSQVHIRLLDEVGLGTCLLEDQEPNNRIQIF